MNTRKAWSKKMQFGLASLWAEITRSHLCSWQWRVSVTETIQSCLSLGASTELTGAEVSAPMPYLAGGEWEKGKTSPWLPPVGWSTVPDSLCLVASIVFEGSAAGLHSSLCSVEKETTMASGWVPANTDTLCLWHQQKAPSCKRLTLLTPLQPVPLLWNALSCCLPQKEAEYGIERIFSSSFKSFLTIT